MPFIIVAFVDPTGHAQGYAFDTQEDAVAFADHMKDLYGFEVTPPVESSTTTADAAIESVVEAYGPSAD